MIHLTKQFGKYTITLTEGEPYTTDPTIRIYNHIFEVAITGTYERVMIDIVTKNKRIDPYIFYENHQDFISSKHFNKKNMTESDWKHILIRELADELKAERRRILSGKLKPSEIFESKEKALEFWNQTNQ